MAQLSLHTGHDGLKGIQERYRNVQCGGASLMASPTETSKRRLSRGGISALRTNRSHVRLECWPPQDLKPKLPHHAPNHVRERTERVSGERVSLLGRYNLIQSHCGKVPESRAFVGEPHVASLLCVTSWCDVSEQSIGASGHWYTGNRSHEVKRLLRAMRQLP